MDDLDHSMHIAEYDWTSFYEESEECGLLQPSLACPDNLSLSDSEDSGNSSSVFSTGHLEPQRSTAANSDDEAESNAAGCCMEEVQINQSGSQGEPDDLTTKAEEDSNRWVKSDICLNFPGGNAINTDGMQMRTAEHITEAKNGLTNVQSAEGESTELKKDGAMQTESDTSTIHELDNHTEVNVNEPHTADGGVSKDVSSAASRAEKERWFVTVSDSPARQRVRTPAVKKKRRQKKTCRNNHMCQARGEEKSCENVLELEIKNESEGGRDNEYATKSNQSSGGCPCAKENPESVQMGIDNLLDQLVTTHRNKHDPSSSASTSHDTFTAQDPSGLNSTESDELGDSVEFLSTHSDSESYLSATESVEEPQHPFFLLSLTENTDADDTQDREMRSSPDNLSCNVTAASCEGYESTDVEPTLTFPSAAQSVNKMPDDNSACDNDTNCTLLGMPSDTPGLHKHEINLSASGFSSGEQLSLSPIPDVTLTPCSVADSPETYAVAAGHTRPVYAISAFWDEMEKLTINDILQLRMGRSTPPRDKREAVTPSVDDFPTNHSSLADTVEYNLSDGGLMDTSDTADSDYFTQPDESKPDRSSCEFSTSDFEEEYWQFLGASRNPSPDPQSKDQQRTGDSPLFAREEEESTGSEGRETPVPTEDFAGPCIEDQDANTFISSELAWRRQITKSKSVRNVQSLNTEDLSLLGNNESSLFVRSCPSLEGNMLLKASDSLGTLIPAPFLSNTDALDEHTETSIPEVFEYFFREDKAKRDSQCVTVYDSEDISVAPVFDYTLCTFRDETPLSFLRDSQCSEEKPIPIFSCSYPTVRELTFPNSDYVFLSADCEDVISPIRVVSHSFIHSSDCRTSAAAPHGFLNWKSLLSIRRIRFHDKGSIWCRGSDASVFPVEAEKTTIKGADVPVTVVTEGHLSSVPFRLCRELAIQETIQTTRREGIFSTLRQSDMCLVCIAFASWVLRSSDPEADDAWKAALLANVSALSAIQYLRQYVKKNPPQDDP